MFRAIALCQDESRVWLTDSWSDSYLTLLVTDNEHFAPNQILESFIIIFTASKIQFEDVLN